MCACVWGCTFFTGTWKRVRPFELLIREGRSSDFKSLVYNLGIFRCYFVKIYAIYFLRTHLTMAWALVTETFSIYFLDHMVSFFGYLLVALPQNFEYDTWCLLLNNQQ